ncbi:phage baseplate assembly protein V [Yersinia rohdei]|uniref:phage baseplate assembly protein V n=1 Tax=Yersinia rohdei TaxID=29485 RepID=UPI0025AA7FC6|nr:phage baseplate assembly protein V [Yersinia rohdei]MDN0093871.1 phage baseplate assembly protein V [Yersinia rohdei]
MNILIAGLKHLLANIIRIGIVSDVSLANGLCRVKIGNLETDWLNWLTLRAGRVRFWSAPSVDEQVMVLSIGGELTTGFVLPAIFSDARPAASNKTKPATPRPLSIFTPCHNMMHKTLRARWPVNWRPSIDKRTVNQTAAIKTTMMIKER